jgi:signal transduction histidine kinase
MFIVLSGHAALWADRGGGRHKVIEWRGGDVMGLLPYSRMGAPPGDSITEERTELLLIRSADFPAMIRDCHEVTSNLIHVMLDRARQFTFSDLHDEKMVSLGKLAAGLAHELNNPASAVARSAKQLTSRLIAAEMAARSLGAARLDDAQLATLDATRESCLAIPATAVRSPIEQADREDTIADWLEAHRANPSIAEQLAETGVTMKALDDLAQALEGETLDAALRWIATGCSVRSLALEIERAAYRISDLVTAVKGFTYMDQATTPQPVDVGEGLLNTLAVLKAKARSKSVGVVVNIEEKLPRIDGFGGELNQVWANLIDNAIDAVAESGHVEVTATHEGQSVVVRIIDDGPGIPQEIRDRIFDPFFTTKPIGAGTGLGLDITRRLIRRHDGVIDIESQPGRTAFTVSLPAASVKLQSA